MGERQQALAKVILRRPGSRESSSFIGVDGTNTTLNSGRIQITLKPLEERKISAVDVIRRLQPKVEQVAGITLFMQPVQDLDGGRPHQPYTVSNTLWKRRTPTSPRTTFVPRKCWSQSFKRLP
jgi:multidrug efflux pump subunit AcrB